MFKKLLKFWFDFIESDSSRETKVLQVVSGCALIAFAFGAIMSALLGLDPLIIVVTLAGAVGIVLVYYLGRKYQKIELSSTILTLFINCVFMPFNFFIGGGMQTGASIWFVLGLFSIFLLLRGKRMWLVLTVSIIFIAATYLTSYYHPEYVVTVENEMLAQQDIMNSVIIVSMICGLVVIFQNKLYEKEQKQVMQQNREIEKLYKSKNRFFANMSHEIRTPINTIIGLNEMILREEVSDEIAENAIHIQEASKLLLALINDILDMSKLESGKMEIVPVQYETGTLFSELVNLIWIRAHEKKLEFRVDVSPEMPSMLYGDEVRLKQIMTNLLTNAVKYTEKGTVTLTARSEKVDQNRVRLTISVKDTGIGIRKEDMQRLFHSFQRMDERVNAHIEGTGLGLSIAGQLAEMMGGTITVDSIYQRGSVFTLQLEQDIVDGNPMGRMDFMLKDAAGRRKRYKQSFEAPEARVLIVDDNETNLLVARKLLRDTKVQVDTAVSGRAALDLTKQFYYHAIFMDHMMPEMDGVETLNRIRKQENGLCREVPVIALTANVMVGAEQIYRDMGFKGYLAKPINGALFEATLQRHLPKELLEYYEEQTEEVEEEGFEQTYSDVRKKKIHITTDCVCDLPESFIDRYDIGLMYCYINVGNARFSDLSEISSNNLIEYMGQGDAKIYSEYATLEEYEAFFGRELGKGDQIIHITTAQNASEGYELAVAAAQGFDNVTVLDSGHLSTGQGMLVLYVAELAEKGYSRQEIMEEVERIKNQISTTFIIPSTDYMYTNKRIPLWMKRVADIFQLHLIMEMKKSHITLGGIEHGKMGKSYANYIRKMLKGKKNIDERILFITYAGCSVSQLHAFRREVEKYQKFERIVFQKASATISSNCGVGSMGLIYMKKDPKKK